MAGVLITAVVLGFDASLSPIVDSSAASQLTRPWPVARALAVIGGVAAGVSLLELMAFGLLAGLTALVSGGNSRAIRIAAELLVGGLLLSNHGHFVDVLSGSVAGRTRHRVVGWLEPLTRGEIFPDYTATSDIESEPNWLAVGSAQQNQLSVRRGGRGRFTSGAGRS